MLSETDTKRAAFSAARLVFLVVITNPGFMEAEGKYLYQFPVAKWGVVNGLSSFVPQ